MLKESQVQSEVEDEEDEESKEGESEREAREKKNKEEELEACEMFMNMTFTELVKKVLEERVYPEIFNAMQIDIDIKNRVSLD
jgi:hypothetical protein